MSRGRIEQQAKPTRVIIIEGSETRALEFPSRRRARTEAAVRRDLAEIMGRKGVIVKLDSAQK